MTPSQQSKITGLLEGLPKPLKLWFVEDDTYFEVLALQRTYYSEHQPEKPPGIAVRIGESRWVRLDDCRFSQFKLGQFIDLHE